MTTAGSRSDLRPAPTAAGEAPGRRWSVIVPTRDTRQLTLACLASVRRDDPSAEIVLVDDGGRDGTATAARDAGLADRVLERERSDGYSVAVNEGAAVAGGDLLMLLNSDAQLLPGALAAARRAFDEDPALGVGGARLQFPDRRPQWSGGREPTRLWFFGLGSGLASATASWRRAWRNARRDPGQRVRPVDWVPGAAMAIRREVWSRCGPLETRFRFYAQDLDFCRRAADRGYRVAILEQCVVLHHLGATISGDDPGADLPSATLWRDLLLWAREARGPRWADGARRCLVWGARLRRFVALAQPSARRRRRRRDALRQAIDALRGETARRTAEDA